MPVKIKTVFVCRQCGYETPKWMGRCPSCGLYNSMDETAPVKITKAQTKQPVSKPAKLNEISLESGSGARTPTGIGELDRVLSGGIVGGSVILLGGDPGVGKSTLLLQICKSMKNNPRILYISGEESAGQLKMRAERLGARSNELYLLTETDLDEIEAAVSSVNPALIMVDSIQTMRIAEIASLPGSVTQVRECAARFTNAAKKTNSAVILVGHVTKEGTVAGPRILEHMVDAVLYFEGERNENYRIIRAVKNRFGSTNEIGVFEMRGDGLVEIGDPSAYMLAGRPFGVPGSAVTCCVEGTRPILAEVQALVSYTNFGTPRRTATGMDYNRVVMLIAVLEKRAGYKLQTYDCYINVAGGMRITEPAADAGAVAALASCYKNKSADAGAAVFGEIGLSGELRAVRMAEKRIIEAQRQGFASCVVPKANLRGLQIPEGLKVYGASHIGEMLELIFV